MSDTTIDEAATAGSRQEPETVVSAGRKGGEATRLRHGRDHYARIGKLGGEALRDKGLEHFEEIGRKGGDALVEAKGPEHMSSIGKRGAQVVKSRYGPGYYQAIGRYGALVRWGKVQKPRG